MIGPELSSSRRSRRRLSGRPGRPPPAAIPALLAALAALIALAALATSAGGGHRLSRPAPRSIAGSSTPLARRLPSVAAAAAHPGSAPIRRAPSIALRENRAIDAVLRRTPFITVGGGRRREIALTFDDGPSPYTAKILRILSAAHVPATFFVVGQQLNSFSAYLRQELDQGQRVEDHTENHAWLSHLTGKAQLGQIRDVAVRVRSLGAAFPRLFRPPYGAFNHLTLAVTRFTRMLLVLWSVDTEDWARPGTASIVRRALRGARPGAIVLMHDGGGDRSETVAALRLIIPALRRRGFRLVTVPRLMLDDPPARPQKPPRFTGG